MLVPLAPAYLGHAWLLTEQCSQGARSDLCLWSLLMQGKNRPLDEDELEFLNSYFKEDTSRLQQQRREEQDDLQAFRLARQVGA